MQPAVADATHKAIALAPFEARATERCQLLRLSEALRLATDLSLARKYLTDHCTKLTQGVAINAKLQSIAGKVWRTEHRGVRCLTGYRLTVDGVRAEYGGNV